MFTATQYREAIAALEAGAQQLEPDGRPCSICEDTGHQAWGCGRNPLLAMRLCGRIARESEALHETLHVLAGHETYMGEQVGPARVVVPDAAPPGGA